MFEIGNSLREARTRQKLDFPQVETAIKIRAKYLRALEDEQFDVLPAQTYVKGFLRTYADYLGLDGQLYVDEYNSRFVVEAHDDAPARVRRSSPRARQQRRMERKVLLLTLLGIAAVTALVFVAWSSRGSSGPAVVLTTNTTPATPPVPTLVITGKTRASVIEVRAGSALGHVLYKGTLGRGETQRFTQPRLWVRLTHPQAVQLKVDGKPVPVPGRRQRAYIVTRQRVSAAGA